MTDSEQIRKVLDDAIGIPGQDAYRVKRDYAINLPWKDVYGAGYFALAKLSRCVFEDEVGEMYIDPEIALREIPDVLAYLCRMYGLTVQHSYEITDPYDLQVLANLAVKISEEKSVVEHSSWNNPTMLICTVFAYLSASIGLMFNDSIVQEKMSDLIVAKLARALWLLKYDEDQVLDEQLIAAGFDPEELEKKGEQLAKRLLKERKEKLQTMVDEDTQS